MDPDHAAAAAELPTLDELRIAAHALDVPLPEVTGLHGMAARAKLLIYLHSWTLVYAHGAAHYSKEAFETIARWHQDADLDAVGVSPGRQPDGRVLDQHGADTQASLQVIGLQVQRLNWTHQNVLECRGDEWNPIADTVLKALEGCMRLLEAWATAVEAYIDGDHTTAADGSNLSPANAALVRDGIDRIGEAYNIYAEGSKRAHHGDV